MRKIRRPWNWPTFSPATMFPVAQPDQQLRLAQERALDLLVGLELAAQHLTATSRPDFRSRACTTIAVPPRPARSITS
jgi:hypothetical protein